MGFDAIDWLRLISPVGLSWFFVPLVDHCFLVELFGICLHPIGWYGINKHEQPMRSINMNNQ
jgi:hypothetical protein